MAGFLCPHGSHHAGFFVSFFFTPSYYHPPFGGMIYFAPTADRGDTPWHHAPNRFGRIRWHHASSPLRFVPKFRLFVPTDNVNGNAIKMSKMSNMIKTCREMQVLAEKNPLLIVISY